jgi:hypothetical protein
MFEKKLIYSFIERNDYLTIKSSNLLIKSR